MTLTEYVKSFPRLQRVSVRKWIAASLGVSEVYVRSMCNGNKGIPGKYAIAIERLTSDQVSRHVIAPDLYPTELKGAGHGSIPEDRHAHMERSEIQRAV